MYGGTAVSDADREAAAARLREHYAAGRLSLDEFQQRLDAVYLARSAQELHMASNGLPYVGVVHPPGAQWGGDGSGYVLNVQEAAAAMARLGRRVLLAFGLLTAGGFLLLALLITALLAHGGALSVVAGVLLTLAAAGVAAVAALVWLARRLWRRAAWVEAVPMLAGQPWLSRVARMLRLALAGRALWRLRTRLASRA